MELKTIRKDRFQHMEHLHFAKHVLAMNKTANIEKIKPLLGPLQGAIVQEDEALNTARKKEGTSALQKLDEERDKAYRSLQMLVGLKLLDVAQQTVDAAQEVQDVMGRYPDVAMANYSKESEMLASMISDLNGADLAGSVTLLGAKPLIDRLEAANKAFDERHQARYKKSIPLGTYDIKALRAATDKALNAVLRRMDSLDDLEPETAGLAALIREYNSAIDDNRFLLAQRKGTNKVATEKKIEGWRAQLAKLFPKFEEENHLASGSLSFTGKTMGTGAKRQYELAVAGSEKTVWVLMKKDHLVEVVKVKPKK